MRGIESVVNDKYYFNWNLLCKKEPSLNKYCTTIDAEAAPPKFPTVIVERSITSMYNEEQQAIIDEVGYKPDEKKVDTIIVTPAATDKDTTHKTIKYDILYKNRFEGVANHHSVALPPPITLLDVPSVIHTSPTTMYEIIPNKRKISTMRRTCVFTGKDGNIRYCEDYLTVGTQNEFVYVDKKNSYKLVYNIKRKCVYEVHVNKGDKLLLCKNFSVDGFIRSGGTHRRMFYNMIEAKIKNDLPGVALDLQYPDITYKLNKERSLSFLMLQHRYGKPIPWMTAIAWYNTLYIITSCADVLLSENDDEIKRACINAGYGAKPMFNKRRAMWLRRFNKVFRKHTNLTGLVEAVFQKTYFSQSMALFKTADNVSNVIIHSLLSEYEYPQNLYNLLVCIIKTPMYVHNIHKITEALKDRANYGENNNMLNMWVKLSTRLLNSEDHNVVNWDVFRDTMRLANMYGVRVRINKIVSCDDLDKLHNTLSRHAHRDNELRLDAQSYDYVIRPFSHPKSEYDGYTFEFIGSAEQLLDEGTAMRNCSAGYARACATGTSIIFVMKKGAVTYCMLELDGQHKDIPIVQEKTIYNVPLNDKTKKIIGKWHVDIIDMHKRDDKTHYEMSSMEDELRDDVPYSTPLPRVYQAAPPMFL